VGTYLTVQHKFSRTFQSDIEVVLVVLGGYIVDHYCFNFSIVTIIICHFLYIDIVLYALFQLKPTSIEKEVFLVYLYSIIRTRN